MRYEPKLLCNPFFLNGITWICVLILYSLHYSNLYPKISNDVLIFFVLSSMISMAFGYITYKKGLYSYRNISFKQIKVQYIKHSIVCLYLLFAIEILMTGCALFQLLTTGISDYAGKGLPFIHVVVVCGFVLCCLICFHLKISISGDIKLRKKLNLYIWLSIFPFILMLNRGSILSCLLGMSIIYLMHTKKIFKRIIIVSISALLVFFAFGYLGDLRTDTGSKKHLILEIGQASDDFINSGIPKEYYWSYVYITSPIGNFQYNVNNTRLEEFDTASIMSLITYQFMPEMISKRVSGIIDIKSYDNNTALMTESLNVSSLYLGPYLTLGWYGVVVTYLYLLSFIFVTINLVGTKSPYYVSTIACVDVIIVMNLFDNMLIFMGLIPILIFLVSVVLFKKYRMAMYKNRKLLCVP